MKVGRNAACPCGSGKKYKQCHLKIDQGRRSGAPPGLSPVIEEGVLTGRRTLEVEHLGYRVRAVGGQLFALPPNESFHQFLIGLLRRSLSDEWIVKERAKLEGDQHVIVRWMNEIDELFRTPDEHGNNIFSVEMTGGAKSLLTLAYDVYSLLHCAGLVPRIMKRLKSKEEFQGVRFEIAMAAIVARCGFKIEWLKLDGRHCEFEAYDSSKQLTIAFEAKSHHREGVLHQPGRAAEIQGMRVKVGDHVREAIEQAPGDKPFVVFSDLNLPLGIESDEWIPKVEDSLQKSGILEGDSKFSVVFATNFAWHFSEGRVPDPEVAVIEAPRPIHPLPDTIVNLLATACSQYGYVPPRLEELFPDGVPEDFIPPPSQGPGA